MQPSVNVISDDTDKVETGVPKEKPDVIAMVMDDDTEGVRSSDDGAAAASSPTESSVSESSEATSSSASSPSNLDKVDLIPTPPKL